MHGEHLGMRASVARSRRRGARAAGVCLCLALAVPARAQLEGPGPETPETTEAPAEGPALTPGGPRNPLELEAWLDGSVESALEAYHVPGAVVSVVRDGEILLAKGYGLADIEAGTAPDPARTLVRPGSVSKLVTWTALVQQIERGLVDPRADVNGYLDRFTIPATFPKPVTAANLMTHTAGFEDRLLGVFVASPEDLVPLGEWLAADVPARIYPPGKLPAYSNYGAALGGYVVERVSGTPFDDYVEAQIFGPLEMGHSTFRQPVPEALRGDLAAGYAWEDGRFVRKPFEVVQAAPAGALSTTAVDMAHFMIAHLEGGAYAGGRILQPATVEDMHAQHFTADPRVSGWTWGFMEMHLNGRRILWHGGDTFWFHSALVLYPERHLGLFVSFNAPGGAQAVHALVEAFTDRYFPVPEAPPIAPPEGFAARAERFTGEYLLSRTSRHGPDRILSLLQRAFVGAGPEGALRLALSLGDPQPTWWVELPDQPLVFREHHGPDHLVFHETKDAGITEVLLENNPTAVGLALPFWRTAAFQLTALAASLLLLASVLLVVPLGWLVGRRAPASTFAAPARASSPAFPRVLAVLTTLVWLAVFIGLGSLFRLETLYGLPPAWTTVQVLGWIAAALTVFLAFAAVTAWRRGYWGFGARLHFSAVTLASAFVLAFLLYWNLLAA